MGAVNWHEGIVYYDNALDHPDWAGVSPTADMEVYWFHIYPNSQWNAFAFEYMETRISVRYRSQNDLVHLDIHLPAENKQSYPEIEESNSLYRCSIWLCSEQIKNDYRRGPNISKQYNIFEEFTATLSAEQTATVYFGFYTAPWY